MPKVYESDIDPDEFIRSFREEPTRQPSPKKKKEKEQDIPTRQSSINEKSDTDKPLEEEEYLDNFVRRMEHVRPLCKYLMVDIHPDFVRKIKRILSYETGPVCSTKAYINNVLADHFRQYEKFINKRQ
ncbi:MAG: DUF3408 domain-containing protein [Muribaculum sp.]|nr:DUF3408 domain-containing protein [Muribaculum sp.]